jgi:hypothetical protein
MASSNSSSAAAATAADGGDDLDQLLDSALDDFTSLDLSASAAPKRYGLWSFPTESIAASARCSSESLIRSMSYRAAAAARPPRRRRGQVPRGRCLGWGWGCLTPRPRSGAGHSRRPSRGACARLRRSRSSRARRGKRCAGSRRPPGVSRRWTTRP